jgi:ADP-ribose pyrophosphatase YjhB (NUDIX family)
MKTKVLVIGVVEKDGKVLMRKKPEGSLPYKETWYLFGGELTAGVTVEQAIINQVKNQTGIDIKITKKPSWDTEIKADLDGEVKMFIYLDTLCRYITGDLKILDPSIEKLHWIAKDDLENYEIVPPSRELFKKLGYIS